MFNTYPYLNINDLNLDFILNAIREMKYEVTNFVSINAIKYADPIQWNITSQYEKNTIVIDPVTGTAYISVAPVPSGVSLTRPEYWTVVFDLGSFVTRAAQNFTSRWESDTTTTATFATSTGNWLVWGDVLYKALTNITAGDTYVVGSNIEHFTIEDLYNAYLNTVAQILAMIGDLDDLNTINKTDLVSAINEIVANNGDLSNLITRDNTTIVNAVNEVKRDLNCVTLDVNAFSGTTYGDRLKNAVESATQNCKIELPAGDIYVHEIALPTSISIKFVGAGMNYADNTTCGTRIFPKDNTTEFLFSADAIHTDYYEFHSISFNGNDTCKSAIYGQYANGFLIDRCSFFDFTEYAIMISAISNIRGCYFDVPNGLGCMKLGSDSFVTNNEFSKGVDCVYIYGGGNRIIGNLFNEGSTAGIRIKAPTSTNSISNNLIANNYFGANDGFDIYIDADSTYNAHGNIICGNMFECTYNAHDESAIFVKYNRYCQIINNVFRMGNSNASNYVIDIRNCAGGIVADSVVYNSVHDSMYFLSNTDMTIHDIQFIYCAGYNITFDSNMRIKAHNLRSQAGSNPNTGIIATNSSGCEAFDISYGNTLTLDAGFKNVNYPVTGSTTLTIPLATNSVAVNKCLRYGSICTYSLDVRFTNAVNAGTVIATIPVGYRATFSIIITCNNNVNNYIVTADANGDIKLNSGPLAANERLFFTITAIMA